MKISPNQVARIILAALFFICMLFANFYAIRKGGSYVAEMLLYDKLLVAYNIGGRSGLEKEIEKILSEDKFPHELALAREFKNNLKNLSDSAAFLREKVRGTKQSITRLRNLRDAAIALMFIIFSWRLIVNLSLRFRRKKKIK